MIARNPRSTPCPGGGGRAVLAVGSDGSEQRVRAALDGVPCLLVVADGDPFPTVGPGEDWVRASADERDVAARLADLARTGRPPVVPKIEPGPAPAPPEGVGPAAMAVLARLSDRAGILVGGDVLRAALASDGPTGPDALDEVVAELVGALRSESWTIVAVGGGFLLDRVGAVDR